MILHLHILKSLELCSEIGGSQSHQSDQFQLGPADPKTGAQGTHDVQGLLAVDFQGLLVSIFSVRAMFVAFPFQIHYLSGVQSPFWIRFPCFVKKLHPISGAEARGLFLRLLWLAFCVLDVKFWCRCDRKLAFASVSNKNIGGFF
jgi:hypothetical protein